MACDCGRCATAAASGAQCLIAGIAGQAEHAVLGMAAQSPLWDVRFADHDATCGSHSLHMRIVVRGPVVFKQRGPAGSGESLSVGQILDGYRKTVQPPLVVPCSQLRIALPREIEAAIGVCEIDECIQVGVHCVNALEECCHDLHAARRARLDGVGQFDRGEVSQGWHAPTISSLWAATHPNLRFKIQHDR